MAAVETGQWCPSRLTSAPVVAESNSSPASFQSQSSTSDPELVVFRRSGQMPNKCILFHRLSRSPSHAELSCASVNFSTALTTVVPRLARPECTSPPRNSLMLESSTRESDLDMFVRGGARCSCISLSVSHSPSHLPGQWRELRFPVAVLQQSLRPARTPPRMIERGLSISNRGRWSFMSPPDPGSRLARQYDKMRVKDGAFEVFGTGRVRVCSVKVGLSRPPDTPSLSQASRTCHHPGTVAFLHK
ncbi:unnamed protein product, partial [Protopolystoma xenopodis]